MSNPVISDNALKIKMLSEDAVWFEELVLCRLAGDKAFLSQLIGTLGSRQNEIGKAEKCNDFSNPQLNALFFALRHYMVITGFKTTAEGLSGDLFAQCLQQLSNQGELLTLTEIPTLLGYMGSILQKDWKAARGIIDDLVGSWLKMRRTNLITHLFRTDNWSAEQLADAVTKEHSSIDKLKKGQEESFYAFGDHLENSPPDVERFSTRLARLDQTLSGGFGRGESFLGIAAMGAGKTALTSQLTVAISCHGGKKGLVITTEAKAAQIDRRSVSNFCKIPYGQVVNGFRKDRLNPVHIAAYEKMRGIMQPLLRIKEWPKGSSRSVLTGFDEEIKRAQDEMGGLDYILLDWIGGALGDMETDPGKVRMIYQLSGDNFARCCIEHNLAGVAFAQGHVDRAVNKVMVDSRALAECKQLGREFTGVFGLSCMYATEDNMVQGGKPVHRDDQAIFVSKARIGEGGLVPVFRDMKYQCFRDIAEKPPA